MAKIIKISSEHAGQRIDNFLMRELKGVPKTRIYRALRKGEVRVNKGRTKAEYKLQEGDEVRVPPIRVAESAPVRPPSEALADKLEQWILYEDDQVIIVNKPSGMPVHGGSGVQGGLIELLRIIRPQQKFLELVHRLDRDTSGCLLIAKKRSALVAIHRLWKDRKIHKRYWALVKGRWQGEARRVKAPLRKNVRESGERMVKVDEHEGKPSETVFRLIKQFKDVALVEAEPVTGRTHQIRVHAAHIGHPIVGDERYGDREFDKAMRKRGYKRLMLHSSAIAVRYGDPERWVGVCALCAEFDRVP